MHIMIDSLSGNAHVMQV